MLCHCYRFTLTTYRAAVQYILDYEFDEEDVVEEPYLPQPRPASPPPQQVFALIQFRYQVKILTHLLYVVPVVTV